MLKHIRGLNSWHQKDYRMIYKLWKWRIVKQYESNGDPKIIVTIEFGGKLTSYWKTSRRQSWKWKGICKAYIIPILEFDVGQMSFDNKRKIYKAQVISTTRGGMTWNMD